MPRTIERGGLTITVYRYAFRGGYYAEARNASGQRVAFTGVYSGKGGMQRAIQSAVAQAAGESPVTDRGCPG